MERALEVYYEVLASLREYYSDFNNSHQDRLDRMNEYHHMLEHKDSYVSMYAVDIYVEDELAS